MTLTRKGLKKPLSLFGATIILATFIAKDARTAKLKELGDSLEVAQNKFDIETQERKTYNAVRLLDREIYDQLALLHRRFDQLDGYSPKLMSNEHPFPCQMLNHSLADLLERQGDFQYVSALVRTFPDTIKKQYDVVTVKQQFAATRTKLDLAMSRCPDSGSDPPVTPPTLDEAMDVDKSLVTLETTSNDMYSKVLADATAQHDIAEKRAKHWTIVYYILYAIGWLVTVAGILLGEDDDKSVIEESEED